MNPAEIKLELGKRYIIKDCANHELEQSTLPTLRDLAIILECCMGEGVMWNLSYELSKRLEVSFTKLDDILHEIVLEYYEMGEKLAMDKFFDTQKNPKID